jgi:hypothetical protein
MEARMRRGWWLMAAGGVLLAACAGNGEKARTGDSAAAVVEKTVDAPLRALSWRLESPASWDDRVRIVDDPEGVQRLSEQGIRAARLFEYLPRDTSIVPQTLLGVYVYDSTAWAKLEGEEGPPQGEVVTRGPGVVYVVGFPQSNPFAAGSADSVEFDKRAVTMKYVKRAFHVVK